MERRLFLSFLGLAAAAPKVLAKSFIDLGSKTSQLYPAGPFLEEIDAIIKTQIMPGLADNFFKNEPILGYMKKKDDPLYVPKPIQQGPPLWGSDRDFGPGAWD